MEGWLYGLFALLGVLAGGLFTYLGMKKQLEQQRELDSCAWRREVRSKPLLKLRDELAAMATKQDRVVASAHKLHTRFGMTEEEAYEEFYHNIKEINAYMESGEFEQTLFTQYDKELIDKVNEIIKEYRLSFFNALNYKGLKATELVKAMEVFNRNKDRIIEIQSLIITKLEEL